MSTPLNAATDGFFAPLHFPEYRTTIKRNPNNDLIMVPERLGEISGPVFGDRDLGGIDNDMTQANGGEAAQSGECGRHRRAQLFGEPSHRKKPWSRPGRPTPPGATATRTTPGRPRSTRTSTAWPAP